MISANDKKPVILIVDDQPVNIQLLTHILAENAVILAASSGMQALEITAGTEKPDIILLDINMPVMDGYEVCKRLKDDDTTRDIAVIFITGRGDSSDEEKGFRMGAVDYIIKPFQPAVVRARVRNHINLKIKSDMLREIAHTDVLTGLPNRRMYEEELKKLWKHCARSGDFFSILMIDIDYFKLYNDNYGHGAGDECLRKTASALNKTVNRSFEIIARYGGEEFVAVLPDTGESGAMAVAQNMIAAVESMQILHEFSNASQYVTVSVGCATMRASNSFTAEILVQKADEALYTAKQSGRNRAAAVSAGT